MEDIIKIKSKYECTVRICNILKYHIQYKVKSNEFIVTKRRLKAGKPPIYNNEKERHDAIKESKRKWKHANKPEDNKTGSNYKLPSNKKISYWLMNTLSRYMFDYFVTLNHTDKYILDKYDMQKTKTFDEYLYNIQQEKYSKQGNISLDNLKKKVSEYLEYIEKENKIQIPYYVVKYEQNFKDNWHAHLALRIINPKNINTHNYLNNKWLYSNIHKKAVKKIKEKNKHQQIRNVLAYMLKRIDHYNQEEIVYEINGINSKTPISFIVKMDDRGNYDLGFFEQKLQIA
jgi:hypothetical protein